MKLVSGIYENLISEQLKAETKAAEQERLACIEQPVDSAEQPRMIAEYISNIIQQKLNDESLTLQKRIEIANRIIRDIGNVPKEELLTQTDDILTAVVPEAEKVRLEQTKDSIVRPLTGFRVSNLFTGRQSKIPMYEEILRDIASADKKDVYGNTAPFYCFGFVNYVSSTGDFPMSITWQTQQPIMPQFLRA